MSLRNKALWTFLSGPKSRYFSWNTLRCVPSLAGADGKCRELLVTGGRSKSFSQFTFSSEITPEPCYWAWCGGPAWSVLSLTVARLVVGSSLWRCVSPGRAPDMACLPPPGNRAGRGEGGFICTDHFYRLQSVRGREALADGTVLPNMFASNKLSRGPWRPSISTGGVSPW